MILHIQFTPSYLAFLTISLGLGSRIKPHTHPPRDYLAGHNRTFSLASSTSRWLRSQNPYFLPSSFLGRYFHHSAVQPRDAALSSFRQLLSDRAQHSGSQQNREPLATYRAAFVCHFALDDRDALPAGIMKRSKETPTRTSKRSKHTLRIWTYNT